MITNEQWELIDHKYGKLLTTICSKISGDNAIANFDDNLQDLRIATIDAVSGFAKKENQRFEEFWGTSGFNKYMKTCLWNLKNKKGARISKRYAINKNTVDVTEYSDILVAENHESSSTGVENLFDLIGDKLNEDQMKTVKVIVDHPEYIKTNGKVNITKVATSVGFCTTKTRKVVGQIKNKLQLDM
jgi:hypothetical protein|tara:strand:- start:642 stop:1202 length:561 start_codon:yes stop_codon:yes gene_type:complete